MTYAVQVASIPFAKKYDGSEGRVYLERVDVEDIGVVIGGPDRQGDVTVLFDDRVEVINPLCLDPYDDPTRVQLWKDLLWLEVGNEADAINLYFKHMKYVKDRAAQSGKTCSACGEFKPLLEFRSDASKRDGLYNRCRSCEAAYDASRSRAFQ